MLQETDKLHQLDIFTKPARLLNENDRLYRLSMFKNVPMRTISIDHWVSIELGAKENDIICFRDSHTDIYRLVVSRSKLI